MGSCVDEESSSSSSVAFGKVLSSADANGVITCLRLVGESQVDALWKRLSFPPYVQASFSSLGPQFVACLDRDQGVMNSIYWPEIHISEGLRFPLPP